MSERRSRRAVVKKYKFALDVVSKQGGSKQPINICHELKAPPHEKTHEPSDDEIPLKIHYPVEERGSLRERVNCRKQDHSTITKQRKFTCYVVEKDAYDDRFYVT
jgi:hypothetical protein